jgi:hypothetical protein
VTNPDAAAGTAAANPSPASIENLDIKFIKLFLGFDNV